jgi:hypothetical protein
MTKRAVLVVLSLVAAGAATGVVAPLHALAAAEDRQLRKPERTVEGGVLISRRDPAIRLAFAGAVEYAGADRWVLYDVADCEVHVFVEAGAQRRVKRLYWVQFEGYLPDVPHRYEYDSPGRVTMGGLEFFADGGAQRSDAPYRRPDSDREHVVNLITAKGYRLPEALMIQRFVHLTDDTRRRELMIIYAEDLAPTGHSVDDLREGGKAADRWPKIEKALRRRALAGIKLTRPS